MRLPRARQAERSWSGDQHAVMQQRQHHAGKHRFLAAVHARGRGKHAARFADHRAGEPQGGGLVEEVLERGRHVSEVTGAADEQAVAVLEVAGLRVGQTAVGHRVFGLLGHRRHGRKPAQHRLAIRVGIDSEADFLGHARHAAVAAVKDDQYLMQ